MRTHDAAQDLGFIEWETRMHEGSCHCGAIRLRLPSTPEVATSCNCSRCRRIGGPWVYFEFGSVEIEADPEVQEIYLGGKHG